MAEVVQRHLEDMLSEFEQAKRIGLFTEAEIKYVNEVERFSMTVNLLITFNCQ